MKLSFARTTCLFALTAAIGQSMAYGAEILARRDSQLLDDYVKARCALERAEASDEVDSVLKRYKLYEVNELLNQRLSESPLREKVAELDGLWKLSNERYSACNKKWLTFGSTCSERESVAQAEIRRREGEIEADLNAFLGSKNYREFEAKRYPKDRSTQPNRVRLILDVYSRNSNHPPSVRITLFRAERDDKSAFKFYRVLGVKRVSPDAFSHQVISPGAYERDQETKLEDSYFSSLEMTDKCTKLPTPAVPVASAVFSESEGKSRQQVIDDINRSYAMAEAGLRARGLSSAAGR